MKYKQKARQPERVEEPTAIYGLSRQRRRMQAVQTARRIQAGLNIGELDALARHLGISAETLAGHLHISRSTLRRRRNAGRLDALESDRLLRYARLWTRAVAVLGGEHPAREWLSQPARALDFEPPLDFAETEMGAREAEMGAREAEDLLGRIENGVFS